MKVRYRDRARNDIDAMYARIERDNPEFAQRVENAIKIAGELLAERPELGVATGNEDARRWPMPDQHVTIFYRINWQSDEVDILRVIDGKQVRNLKRVPR